MIVILRLGHRYVRDYRVSTHLALVARAFGADKMLVSSIEDEVKKSINEVNERWGGDFVIEEIGNRWRDIIKDWKNKGNYIIHLTMYGININDIIDEIREKKDIMIIVGAEKVPREVYELSDYNIAIGNQPHSEIAALAVFLDRYHQGRELEKEFKGKFRIKPSNRYKIVEKL
ncbi:MAG: tRNA (cytidine(56)-2'-O)-methyltransferase [Candidatus Nitrosocaldaceae archaeon]|nr:MAG: tRNA (cytidine(56)-2'-O)-methyltransferase [Candidatus Nitrosocaldaceae archaeon]